MKKFSSITRVNSHHISRHKKIKTILVVALCGLLLLYLVPRFVAFVVSLVLVPVHSVEMYLSNSSDSFPSFLRDRNALVEELNAFKYTQSSQSGDRLTSQLLTQENEELRKLLGDTGNKRIVAGVIGRPNTVPYDVLILDKGSDDGIVENAPVFIQDNAVIGSVTKVFQNSSLVTLVTTPNFTVSVYILGPNIYTNAVGIGGGQLRVGVPQGIALEEGNLVILPGVHSGIYGAISVVQSIPTEPEQYGYVSAEIPLSGLRLVSVGDVPILPLSFEEAESIVLENKTSLFQVPVPEDRLVTADIGTTTASSTATSSATTTTP